VTFVLSVDKIANGIRAGRIYIRGIDNVRHCQRGKNLVIFKGELFPDMKEEELFDVVSQGRDQELEGEFFIIFYNNELGNIHIISSKFCWENLFYFYDSHNLIISDDFWEIVNIIEPTELAVDIQSVKEFVIFQQYLFNKTIIKNLEYFPPACTGEFLIKDRSFKVHHYWDFEYKPNEDLTLKKAVKRLDIILNEAMKRIKQKGKSLAYGVGLSGGLDSRLVAYYAVKNGLNLTSFIVGETKPHGFLLSRDHDSARNIARCLGIKHHFEIEYSTGNFQDRILQDVRDSPMRSAGFLSNVKLPEFDILLTGFEGGEFFGSTIPATIEKMSTRDLVDYMMQRLSLMKVKTSTKMSTIVTILFTALNIPSPKLWNKTRWAIEGIIGREEYEIAGTKIHQFIEENKGKDKASILQKFLFFNFNAKNKGGTKQRTFTLFRDPFFIREALTWKIEFLINKSLQTHFFIKILPKLSKIKTQNPDVAIFYLYKPLRLLRKFVSIMNYIIRGRNLHYDNWIMNKDYQKCTLTILSRKNAIFENIFDVNRVLMSRKYDPLIYNNIIKVKQILDLINDKGYKRWF